MATSRNACCAVSPATTTSTQTNQNSDEIERDHPVWQSRPAYQPDKCEHGSKGEHREGDCRREVGHLW